MLKVLGLKIISHLHLLIKHLCYCDLGVASFEKNIGAGGGSAEIVNSIFYNSITDPVFVDDLSILTVSNSLSNTKNLDGLENVKAEPNLQTTFFSIQTPRQ